MELTYSNGGGDGDGNGGNGNGDGNNYYDGIGNGNTIKDRTQEILSKFFSNEIIQSFRDKGYASPHTLKKLRLTDLERFGLYEADDPLLREKWQVVLN